jgi:DNA mismatch repair protein MutS2
MPYPSDIEVKLGVDIIRQRLDGYCLSSLGQKRLAEMSFLSDYPVIIRQLKQTLEFVQILERGDTFPSTHFLDPEEYFKKASIEGNYLDEPDFLGIAYSVETIIACREYLLKNRELCPYLVTLTDEVDITFALVGKIHKIIDEHAHVRDSASAELGRIRKRLREEQARSRRLIDQVYRAAVGQNWVPDGALPTIRGGRLVIPLLAEHKRRIKGFILDESATGQTIYLEPAEVLDANNEIRDLEYAEKREVIRLLQLLTNEVRLELPMLHKAYDFLSYVDFIRAKARLARELQATLPVVVDRPFMCWEQARHPLLYLSFKGKRDVVPLTIHLTESDRMLLVSGPNAGGKSVCLKTVGMLQYMLQCGLLIPVHPDSTAGIFDEIFIDIGDQQSLENDLSTYSSHLKNLAYFIRDGNPHTLVLMDELGSGTDPDFGGAIAQAILDSLLKKQVWGVATTHYHNLKLFAEQSHSIRNGSMRFDEQNMVPLYRLDIGKPGSSFALEIAQKTGIPDETLQAARQLAGKELVGLENLVRSLEKERVALSQQHQALEQRNQELSNLLNRYNRLSSELDEKKKVILEKAKEEARQLLAVTNREIEKTIRHIRENQAQKQETIKARKKIGELVSKISETQPAAPQVKIISGTIQAGDRVQIIGQQGSGIVIAVKGKRAQVQFGDLKTKAELNKLQKVSGGIIPPAPLPVRLGSIQLNEKRASYSPVLDVRGKRAEEVIPVLIQFLDTSVLLGQAEIKILHGKGEGVLRKIVRDELKKYKPVVSFSDEHVERGGDGITVAILK